MSNYTRRVLTPQGRLYVSDDLAGDYRLEELFTQYGDLRFEFCEKIPGHSLDEAHAEFSLTISEELGQ